MSADERLEFDTTPLLPPLTPVVELRPLSVEQIALMYRVPYWLIDATRGKPSWWRRPVWRTRAWWWAR